MSSTGRKRIAVIGATGQQGGAVMHALQARGQFTVRALTDDRLALANKVAGGQPTSFAVWARERTSRLLNRRPSDLVSTLLCAGLTTFSALRNSPARAGDLVAVLGIGGLGHLGVQYARHMGFEVAAIGRGTDKAELAKKLGAHHYINSAATNPAEALQALGGAVVVLATAAAGKAAADTVKGLPPRGVMIEVGAPEEPIEVSSTALLFGSRRVEGALTGTPATGDATLKFSVLTGVAAMIETMPLEKAADAYAKMMSGKARFRMVLTVDR